MAKTAEKATESVPLQIIEDVATGNRLVVYTTRTGTHVELQFDGEEPWFTQADLASMFGVDVRTVNEHIQRYKEASELDDSTIRDFRIVRQEGSRRVERAIAHYSLDVAFYVGYRVNSDEGKLFRRWATNVLVQVATKGFVVDRRQLSGKQDRISELREIIRDLRSDEANLYAELRTILAMCKDYEPGTKNTTLFFAHFQDCLLFAITGNTSAEIKMSANASKPNMGLRVWSDERDHPIQEDALSSKNYLGPLQLEDLNRLVNMVLDFFEDQVKRGWLVSMNEAQSKLVEILTVNKRHVLRGFGSVKSSVADAHVKEQYKIHKEARDVERKAKAVAALNAAAKALGKGKKSK